MRVSTFTKSQRFNWGALCILLAAGLVYTRKLPLLAVAFLPAAAAAFLIMRTRILRHFAKIPVRQVAYAKLIEPVTRDRVRSVRVRDEDGNYHYEQRTETVIVGWRKKEVPEVIPIDPCYVDFSKYIASKGNQSVLIFGRSGMGKTELNKLLLLHIKIPKIVLSFKPGDAYLQLPYQVIDVSKHIPNPFPNPDDFAIAYALAFPANLRGIMISQARAMVKNLAATSKDWNEFKQNVERMKKRATDIQMEALVLIEGQTGSLAVGEGSFNIDLMKDIVLDLSGLDENAKTFYAEMILRQVWNQLRAMSPDTTLAGMKPVGDDRRPNGPAAPKVAIIIDEVHRLTQLYEVEAKSIIDTLMREVRKFGALYTATQNLTDIPDKLRQFATEIAFHTTSENDLQAIGRIDPAYAWIVKELRPYEFIDLAFRVGKGGLLPIFRADPIALPERKAQYDQPAEVTPVKPKSADVTDYESEILGILAKEPLHQTGIDRALGIEREDSRRLTVKKELKKLLDGGEIGRTRYLDSAGKEKVLYYVKDPTLSPMHDYMQKEAVSVLTANNVQVSRTNATGNGSVPDVETPEFDVEIETGLKHSGADLQERLSKSTKRVIILAPNYEEAGRYSRYASETVKIATMSEFKEAIRLVAANRSQDTTPSVPPEGGRGADP